MTLALRAELLDVRYRAARSNYTLIPFDNLPTPHQDLLRSLKEDPDFFGILSPVGAGGLGIQSVTNGTAALLRSLVRPGYLAEDVRIGGPLPIARLVLDGVLDVEWEGNFLSGPSAHVAVFGDAGSRDQNESDRLSWAALRYGESFAESSAFSLSERLYTFNTIPASPEWRQKLANPTAVLEFLRLGPSGEHSLRLQAAGFEPSYGASNWSSWNLPGFPDVPTVKLYVSPLPQYLPDALHAVADIAGESAGVGSLKLGNDIYGILRPDKLVLYFARREHLFAMAQRLKDVLGGMPAQGVPFTAQLDSDGLLSWGADPPESPAIRHWLGRESWRSRIAMRLASSLVAARGDRNNPVSPSRFAVDRLALEGVDPNSWCPTESFSGFLNQELMGADAAH